MTTRSRSARDAWRNRWRNEDWLPRTQDSPQQQLRRGALLAVLTGGVSLRAVALIAGVGPLRAAEIVDELREDGVLEPTPHGRWVTTTGTRHSGNEDRP